MSNKVQQVHEEILDMVENSKGELKTMVIKLTNAKNPAKGLKFATLNKWYQEMFKTHDPEDIHILAKPMDGGFVTLKRFNYNTDSLKHSDDNYYSSLSKEVKDRLQGTYYSAEVTINMIKKKSKKNKK